MKTSFKINCFTLLAATLLSGIAFSDDAHAINRRKRVVNQDQMTSLNSMVDQGKTDEAIAKLNSYLKNKKQKDAQGHYLLGVCYAKKKEYRKARQHLRIAVRLGRGSTYSQKANKVMLTIPRSYTKPRTGPMTKFLASLFGFGRQRAAGQKPTPTVIDFYANWCHPCKKLEQSLTQVTKKYGDRVKVMRVDVDDPKNDRIVDQYEVSPIPTVIFLNTEGEVVDYSIGFSGEKSLSKGIEKILKAGSSGA